MTALRPPPQWSHLRWHWIYVACSGFEPWEWDRTKGLWLPHRETVWHAPELFPASRYHGPCHPDAILPDPDEQMVERVASRVVQEVCELGDRTSPDDWPEAMLVTGEELHAIVIAALKGERG